MAFNSLSGPTGTNGILIATCVAGVAGFAITGERIGRKLPPSQARERITVEPGETPALTDDPKTNEAIARIVEELRNSLTAGDNDQTLQIYVDRKNIILGKAGCEGTLRIFGNRRGQIDIDHPKNQTIPCADPEKQKRSSQSTVGHRRQNR